MASNQPNKAATVRELMLKLKADIDTNHLTDVQREEILCKLKVHGRDVRGADDIYCVSGVTILCKYAFNQYSTGVSREALRCIANALLLQPQLATTLLELGHDISLAKVYEHQNDDDEFLAARTLFLLTYGTKADFPDLIRSHQLIQSLENHLARHAEAATYSTQSSSQITTMALSETLKLTFNLANRCPSENIPLSVAVPHLCTLICATKIPTMPLDAPLSVMINALAILEVETVSTPAASQEADKQYSQLVTKLVDVLEKAVEKYKPLQLDTQVVPLMTVLRKLYDVATPKTKSTMQTLLLPNDSERDQPLGKSSSMASKLLCLTSFPGLANLPGVISELMFELSEKDASRFVKNIGYGYAAGYLMTHKIPIPESAKQTHTRHDPNEVPINPITGQRLDKEVIPDIPEMTYEEKEREAERLFVLFERLRATGVVDVENPVRQAMREGRFEEVDSDPD